MDRRERYNDTEEMLRTVLDGFQSKLWTALPGIVQSFDAAAMTVTVQPTILAQLTRENETFESVALPLLLDCPVIFPCGGGFTLTFPITAGDECLVIFASRCIDAWWQSGGLQPQAEFRMHDLSDGFALVGVRSQLRVIPGVSTSATQLRSDDGATYVEVADGTIRLVAESVQVEASAVTVDADTVEVNATEVTVTAPTASITGNVEVTGNIEISGTAQITGGATISGIPFGSHRHTGVDTGSGTSGGPVA